MHLSPYRADLKICQIWSVSLTFLAAMQFQVNGRCGQNIAIYAASSSDGLKDTNDDVFGIDQNQPESASHPAPIAATAGPFSLDPVIYQELVNVREFNGFYPTFSPWVTGSHCAGFVVRDETSRLVEGRSPITACRVLA